MLSTQVVALRRHQRRPPGSTMRCTRLVLVALVVLCLQWAPLYGVTATAATTEPPPVAAPAAGAEQAWVTFVSTEDNVGGADGALGRCSAPTSRRRVTASREADIPKTCPLWP